jgi:hypothetical protein
MKKALVYGFAFLISSNALALDSSVENVKAICALVEGGKSSSISFKASADAKGLVRIVAAGVKGDVTLTKEQHEGLQRVLQSDQAKDYANYRTCVKDTLPYFKAKPVASAAAAPAPAATPNSKAGIEVKTGDKSPVQIGNGNTVSYN